MESTQATATIIIIIIITTASFDDDDFHHTTTTTGDHEAPATNVARFSLSPDIDDDHHLLLHDSRYVRHRSDQK
jgi:hypothetical protein